jgi:MFS family permease
MSQRIPCDTRSLLDGEAGRNGVFSGAVNDEFTVGWPVVLACFCLAVFAWGFGFYGQSAYLAALRDTRGWSASLISGATTTFYLWGALLLALVPGAIERFGVRDVAVAGALLLGAGTVSLSGVTAPWQMYACAVVMGVGWACTSTTSIAVILAQRFDRRRGLAISLALNGASVGGLAVAPALVGLSHVLGLALAVWLLVGGALVVLLPVLVLCLRPAPQPAHGLGGGAGAAGEALPAFEDRASLLRDPGFWSVALPFALALMAQVGFIVHQVAFLLPRLGVGGAGSAVALTAGAATVGRLALATIIDRLHQRRVAAVSFGSQAGGLGLMLLWPASPAALYLGSLVFGLSVGNVVTLPSLIVQREFASRSFGLVIGLSSMVGQLGLSVGPALLGAVHDATGAYSSAIGLCVGLELVAGVLVLARRPGASPLDPTKGLCSLEPHQGRRPLEPFRCLESGRGDRSWRGRERATGAGCLHRCRRFQRRRPAWLGRPGRIADFSEPGIGAWAVDAPAS